MYYSSKKTAGFTLIELLVSMAIITMITSIVLVNHNKFNGSIFLSNLSYDVALSIRQAQIYGLSVREFAGTFDIGYGVHFDIATPTSFFIFADIDRNQRYNSSVDSIVETLTITRRNTISKFCATPFGASPVERCTDSGTPITTLDIAFNRPDPEAVIIDNLGTSYTSARITVSSSEGDTRSVVVEGTGQISVQ